MYSSSHNIASGYAGISREGPIISNIAGYTLRFTKAGAMLSRTLICSSSDRTTCFTEMAIEALKVTNSEGLWRRFG